METETEGKAGVYKELALLELFLRKNLQQKGQATFFLAMEEALFIYNLPNFLQKG